MTEEKPKTITAVAILNKAIEEYGVEWCVAVYEKQAEFFPGIESKKQYVDLSQNRYFGLVNYIIEHDSEIEGEVAFRAVATIHDLIVLKALLGPLPILPAAQFEERANQALDYVKHLKNICGIPLEESQTTEKMKERIKADIESYKSLERYFEQLGYSFSSDDENTKNFWTKKGDGRLFTGLVSALYSFLYPIYKSFFPPEPPPAPAKCPKVLGEAVYILLKDILPESEWGEDVEMQIKYAMENVLRSA